MRVNAILAKPNSNLFDTHRPVLPSVDSDDFIHKVSGILISGAEIIGLFEL